jgi:hypothetical protein
MVPVSSNHPAPDILLLRPGALGDTLLTIDAILALRRRFPGASIELVGNAEGGRLHKHWGLVQSALAFDDSGVTALFSIPPQIPPRWRSAHLAVLWLPHSDSQRSAFEAHGVTALAASPEPAIGATIHVADHLVATLGDLGSAADAADITRVLDRWRGDRAAPVLLHPGSGSPRKNWPARSFAEVARGLLACGRPIHILSGPADAGAVADLMRELTPDERQVIATVTADSALQLAELVAGASAFVGNDSGVSHLSGRLGVPTVAIFVASDPVRWAPRGPRVRVVGADAASPTPLLVTRALEELEATVSSRPARPNLQENGAAENRQANENCDSVDH